MVNYYMIAAMLSVISLIILLVVFQTKKTNYYYMILLILMALANGGYFSISISESVQEAVLANKICYLGGCFVPVTTLFLTCEICNYKVSMWLRGLLYAYSFFVYSMVLSVGFSDIYYVDVGLTKYGNATVLEHTYGIGHVFFYVILYGYIVIQLAVLLYSITKKRAVSRISLWLLLVMETVNICLFIVGRIINSSIEIIPIVYAVDGWFLLYMYWRTQGYSIEDNIAEALKKQDTFGYIMFDKHMNYLGCNEIASGIFPEIVDCVVDRPLEKKPELQVLWDWIESYDSCKEAQFSYVKANKHYDCRVTRMGNDKRSRGFSVELREDTDKWRYMQLLSEHNSELENFQKELERKVNEQTEEIRSQQRKIRELFIQTITALSEAVDAKDRYTSGHSKRVAEYAGMIAARLGKSKEEQDEIYRAGLLHDVGKIRVPAEIINKPGKLTEEEYNVIKIHAVTGYHILRGISNDSDIAVGAKYHHERYDGKGYPNGLSGDKIPEVARILCVADAYDAMASNRSYRNALPQEVVRSEIEKGKGTQFDPDIAEIMLQMIDEDKDYHMKQKDSMQRRVLTVDDEAMNNKIIAHIMKDEPMYEVIAAGSGREALTILEQQDFDLILLDVKMPDMNGIETLKRIREKYRIPVVLMTSDKTLEISMEFMELGCDDYITKPFLPLLLKETIHTMTERTYLEN